jgi:hypothetical protein
MRLVWVKRYGIFIALFGVGCLLGKRCALQRGRQYKQDDNFHGIHLTSKPA